VPRELVEVVGLPVVVTMIGVAWMQAWSWHVSCPGLRVHSVSAPIATLVGVVLGLLLVFQLVLRPGVDFY
jgi:hypothetical protein